MGCTKRLCTAENIFIFINILFAMYSGALLATAARLAWDPSTYAWFRFLCAAQYRVSAGYTAAAGALLAALAALACAAAASAARLRLYAAGVLGLLASEVCYAAWMGASLAAWWRDAPQAELARRGMDVLSDLKPALRAVQRHRDLVRPILDMIEEVEEKAPNNVYVIMVFGLVGLALQVAAIVVALRMARRAARAAQRPQPGGGGGGGKPRRCVCAPPGDEDSDAAEERPPGWRNKANLHMYTILDKIF